MQYQPREENATIIRTYVGFGQCGPQIDIWLKGETFEEMSMTVFWGTQNVDSTADVISQILAVVGAKSWEHLRGKKVRVRLERRDSHSGWVVDRITNIMGGPSFSVREQFEKTWRLSCRHEFSYELGIRDSIYKNEKMVNAKIISTFLGRDENGFRVALQLRNEREDVDGWFELHFNDEQLASGFRIDSAIAALRSVLGAQAWENLHGKVVRAVVDGRCNVMGVGNLMERAFFTSYHFFSDKEFQKAA
jgi:hypothetical protein